MRSAGRSVGPWIYIDRRRTRHVHYTTKTSLSLSLSSARALSPTHISHTHIHSHMNSMSMKTNAPTTHIYLCINTTPPCVRIYRHAPRAPHAPFRRFDDASVFVVHAACPISPRPSRRRRRRRRPWSSLVDRAFSRQKELVDRPTSTTFRRGTDGWMDRRWAFDATDDDATTTTRAIGCVCVCVHIYSTHGSHEATRGDDDDDDDDDDARARDDADDG